MNKPPRTSTLQSPRSSVPTHQQTIPSRISSINTGRPHGQTIPFPGTTPVVYGSSVPYSQGYPPTVPYSMNGMNRPLMSPGVASGYSGPGRRRVVEKVVCFDGRYAKSKQGIAKLIQMITTFIAWVCVASTPYASVSKWIP